MDTTKNEVLSNTSTAHLAQTWPRRAPCPANVLSVAKWRGERWNGGGVCLTAGCLRTCLCVLASRRRACGRSTKASVRQSAGRHLKLTCHKFMLLPRTPQQSHPPRFEVNPTRHAGTQNAWPSKRRPTDEHTHYWPWGDWPFCVYVCECVCVCKCEWARLVCSASRMATKCVDNIIIIHTCETLFSCHDLYRFTSSAHT